MKKNRTVRKNLRLTQSKIDEARRIPGISTGNEPVEQVLDLVVFRQEALKGIDRIVGKGNRR